ncbi:hypothetical protein B5M47_01040 [candidate division CPR3 bacterium 4484_211]|uniref:Nucleotidyl transferase AbiEii/AbiGii toxin family protein n=1 Tax=candidate division CPR3 bacterium 4484_211 TaxID=1968527 RepID=A0A1W9NZ62_UNCC3|nr:MAG: hypothetical protein B5M47_01040 [candidate division CPR3 bacterium 4484_211]
MNLTPAQEKAIILLSKSPLKDKFYWTGGTLLAHNYLHHRKSLDIDLFSEEAFSFEEINRFAQELKKQGKFTALKYQKISNRWEFLFANTENLRVEFVYYNHEKRSLKPRKQLLGVYIDSLEDIAANKTFAYFDRNEPKDLFDIYFLLTKANFTPSELLNLTAQKFGVEFNESSFWSESFKSLSLLEKLKPLVPGTPKERQTLFRKITAYFKQESAKFLQRNLLQPLSP